MYMYVYDLHATSKSLAAGFKSLVDLALSTLQLLESESDDIVVLEQILSFY